MNIQSFIDMIRREGPYTAWYGVYGYDSRPRLEDTTALPVAYYSGNAANHIPDEGFFEEGDLFSFLDSLPNGEIVVLPQYCGSHYDGWERYIKIDGAFSFYDSEYFDGR